MPRKRFEALVVALLLLGCLGAVYLIYSQMTRPGGAFELPDQPAARRRVESRARTPSPPPARAAAPTTDGGGAADAEEREEAPEAPGAARDEPAAPPEDEAAAETAELTLELVEPAAEEDRSLSVTVRDRPGEPISGALVVFREGSLLLYRERTDHAGAAVFRPYPGERGPFRVDAIAHGYLPGTAEAVAAGADTELVLVARPVVEGEVRAPAIGHGLVRLWLDDREYTTGIRPDGTFRFEELDPGRATVQAEVLPYGAASESFFLEAGTSRFVRLRVRAGSKVHVYGRIGFWPGEGQASINGAPVAVSPTGIYQFEKAVVGVNEILLIAPGKAPLRERFTVRSQAKSNYNFSLRKGKRIRGRVRNARTNRPVADAEVRLGFDRGDPRNTRVPRFPIERVPVVRTGPDGRFETDHVDDRLIYLVSVVAPGYGQYVGEVVPGGGSVRIALPEGPFLYGRLRGLGGLPRGAVVTARPIDPDYSPSRLFNVEAWDHARGERDRRGYYGLSGLLPGAYLVRVDAPDFGSVETVVAFDGSRRLRLDLRLRRGAQAADDEAELLSRLPPVAAAAGEGPAPEGATLLTIDARRAAHEKPFPGVRILFFEEDQEFAPPLEFFEEEFDVIGLPEATYRAVLTHPSLKRPLVRDRILLRRGQPVTLEFR
ncbi:MAG: hypothetical protein ACYTEZ_04360 [Planctomycetota bacterium]|jgi:hypothetical protein